MRFLYFVVRKFKKVFPLKEDISYKTKFLLLILFTVTDIYTLSIPPADDS